MTTLLQAAPTVKTTTLEIRGATYEARPIDPGFAGVAALEVTKLASGESYAVVLGHDGAVSCECPDFVVRHADKGTHCKHCKAVLAAGLLVAPISGGSPVADAPPAVVAPAPTFAPITRLDLKRAAFFGLHLPPAPMAEEPAPAPVAEVAPEIPAEDGSPAWTWDAWTDEFTWELGPEATADEAPALACDDESRCPVTEDDHLAWQARQSRPARFAPTPEDDAYASGYYLQFNHGTAADAPKGWGVMRSSAFRLGQADGLLARHRREDEEREAQLVEQERMEDAFGGPGHDWHDSERVEAVGCIEARRATIAGE